MQNRIQETIKFAAPAPTCSSECTTCVPCSHQSRTCANTVPHHPHMHPSVHIHTTSAFQHCWCCCGTQRHAFVLCCLCKWPLAPPQWRNATRPHSNRLTSALLRALYVQRSRHDQTNDCLQWHLPASAAATHAAVLPGSSICRRQPAEGSGGSHYSHHA
jgi:hypothetical protein